jgi:hypothetical protein
MAEQSQITLLLNFAGQNNEVIPRIGRLYCPTSTLAQVATAAYLDNYLKTQNISLLATDFVAAVASDGHQWYKPVFNGAGSCTLTVLP